MAPRVASDPVEPLLAELAQRAAAESEARLAAARAEAESIRAAGEERRRLRRERAMARCDADALASAQPELARATREARQRVLAARRALVERVLGRAGEELRRRAEGGAPSEEWLRARASEVLSFTEGAGVELSCPPSWVPAVERVVDAATVRVIAAADAEVIGLRARDGEGRVVVDDTVSGWLRRERPSLAIAICRAVDPEGS